MGTQLVGQPLVVSRNSHRGFTQFELLICISIILVISFGGYLRYMQLVVDAEQAAFRGVMGWLQAGLNMEMSRALIRGDLGELSELEGQNPMVLVAKVMAPPSNYQGELSGSTSKNAKPGYWYYDKNQSELVYRVHYEQNLEGFSAAPDKRLRFRLKVVYGPADRKGYRRVKGLKLEEVDPRYRQTPLSFGQHRN